MPPIDRIKKVEGQMPHDVGIVLADYAFSVPVDEAIVDVGTYRGRSACYLAYGAQQSDSAHVYAIDAWDLPKNRRLPHKRYHHPGSRKAARYNIRAQGFTNDITLHRAMSVDAARKWKGETPIGLLHLDADPKRITDDVKSWLPKMSPSGTIVISTYSGSLTPQAAAETLKADGTIAGYSVVKGLIVIDRPVNPPDDTPGAGDDPDPSDLEDVTEALEQGAKVTVYGYAGSGGGPGGPNPPDSIERTLVSEAEDVEEGAVAAGWGPAEHEGIDWGGEPTVTDQDVPDLHAMTGKELRDYMRELDMKLGKSRPKAQMIQDIKDFWEAEARQESQP